ncbi:MAG: hypothetical protein U1F36_21815 [Planctomycetota bacterium]
MRHPCSVVLSAFLATTAWAQESNYGPRSFLPPDYDGEMKVDVRRLDDLGVLAELLRSPLGTFAGAFQREFGFSIEDLDRVTYAFREHTRGSGDQEQSIPERSIWVFEGGKSVDLTAEAAGGDPGTLGGVKFVERDGKEMCSPRAGLLVIEGHFGETRRHLISSVLEGKRKGGVPRPEVLELSGRPHLLLSVVRLVPESEANTTRFFPGVGTDWTVETDPPAALCLRVAEDPKTEGLKAEVLVRFQKGDAGPQLFGEKFKGLIASAVEMKQMLPFKDLLTAVVIRTEGRDCVATVDFGTGREAVGKLGKLGLMIGMWGMGSSVERVEAVQAVPAPAVPAPATEPKREDGGDGKR